ncbi:MAG: TetR/AcrR family transcriptional regulator [SAR86 cluster bacterium]|nr:TetR/AcrR family transcriptional regulator [SAR86 cluster bacterium]
MKKSELTRAKLITAVSNLLNKGQKISVASISKEAKTAYGTFYRYFNNLDEIHAATMIYIVVDVAEKLEQQLKKEKSNLFKVYYAWYVAIDLFKGDCMANWLIDNPSSINDAWVLTQPMTSQLLQNAIADKEEPELTAENLRHFKMAQTYIFWTYQNALRELLKGRKSIHVYTDLMNSVNLMNLPSETNKKYLKKVANYIS